jgi:hypothetical protein
MGKTGRVSSAANLGEASLLDSVSPSFQGAAELCHRVQRGVPASKYH